MMSKMHCGSFITDKKTTKLKHFLLTTNQKEKTVKLIFFNKLVGINNFESKKTRVVRDHFTNKTKTF